MSNIIMQDVPSGQADVLQYVSTIKFENAMLPENFTLTVPNVRGMEGMFKGVKGAKRISVEVGSLTSMKEAFSENVTGNPKDLEEVTIMSSTKDCTNYYSAFVGCDKLKRINGVIDFTSASTSTYAYAINMMFGMCSRLADVVFAPNTLSRDVPGQSINACSVLSNTSLVSFANSLVSGSHSLAFGSDLSTKAQAIVGTVSQVTDADSNTYDFFTEDASGTTTLLDFITSTKGWTVA